MFKYIFALIVGALFLMFFVGLAYNYAGGEQKLEATLLAKNFDDQLSILTVSQDAVQSYEFGVESSLSFNNGVIRSGSGLKTKSENIVFSPLKLQGTKLVIWARRWSFPFNVGTFFFLSNANYKHVVVYDSTSEEFAKAIMEEEIPKEFRAVMFNAAQLKQEFAQVRQSYSGFEKAKFIYLSSNPNEALVKAMQRVENFDVVVASPGKKGWDYGRLDFQAGQSFFLGKEMLFGAMFAEDYSNYAFNMGERILPRLRQITGIYIGKAGFMLAALPQCSEYSLMATALEKFRSLTAEDSAEKFASQASALEDLNDDYFGAECPGVF